MNKLFLKMKNILLKVEDKIVDLYKKTKPKVKDGIDMLNSKLHTLSYELQFEAKWFYNKKLIPTVDKIVSFLKPKIYINMHHVYCFVIGLAEKTMEFFEPKAESCLVKYQNVLNVEAPVD